MLIGLVQGWGLPLAVEPIAAGAAGGGNAAWGPLPREAAARAAWGAAAAGDAAQDPSLGASQVVRGPVQMRGTSTSGGAEAWGQTTAGCCLPERVLLGAERPQQGAQREAGAGRGGQVAGRAQSRGGNG
jgi:hypothetical protein